MKYIRTKDGRIMTFESTTEFFTLEAMYGIVGKADMVDELFDEVVAVLPNGDHLCEYCHRLKPGMEALEMLEEGYDVDRERDEIYGAVWTKWGLKYAAVLVGKMAWRLL